MISAEGFLKQYGRMPLSVRDNIPLACKGDDYGTVGNEVLIPTERGRAYGIETMLRWQVPGQFNFVSSLTLFRSEFRDIPLRGIIVLSSTSVAPSICLAVGALEQTQLYRWCSLYSL